MTVLFDKVRGEAKTLLIDGCRSLGSPESQTAVGATPEPTTQGYLF
jgi:hypothetical protein